MVVSDQTAWPAVGLGLLSRMATTLESMLELLPAGREADAATLGRSRYEHAVRFAWLAVEPRATRLRDSHRYDLDQRLKADADKRRHGHPSFTDARRAGLEAELAALSGGKALKLEQLALAADTYWTGKIPGVEARSKLNSFRGLYASLSRWYSGMVHPTALGLNRVTDDLKRSRRRIRTDAEYTGSGPYGMATVVFGLALFAAPYALGWPSTEEIDAAFSHGPRAFRRAALTT